MKNKYLLLLTLTFLSSALLAQETAVYNPAANAAGTGLWSEAGNWTTGTVPGADTKVVFNVEATGTCTLSEEALIQRIVMGDGGPGDTLTVASGGNLVLSDANWSAIGWTGRAVLNVEAGASATFNHHLWMGWTDTAEGHLNVNGGTVTTNLNFGISWEPDAGAGSINVNSGELHCAQFGENALNGSGVLNIGEGRMFIKGDKRDLLNSFIDEGKLLGVNGSGTLGMAYNATTDTTMIMQLPPQEGTTVWTGTSSTDWHDFTNWSDSNVPYLNKVVFNVPDAQRAIVTDSAKTFHLVIGDQGDETIATEDTVVVASGGVLSTGKVWCGIGWNSPGLVIVEEGGIVNLGEHLWIGWGSVGTMHINGGIVNVGGMYGTDFEGNQDPHGQGHMYVNSGQLNLNGFRLDDVAEGEDDNIDGYFQSIPAGSFMDITGGVVTITRDARNQAARYIEADRILSDGGFGTVVVLIDSTLADDGVAYDYVTTLIAQPTVVETSPEDASVIPEGGNTGYTISITFNKGLEPASVESALTVSPEISNMTLAWEGNVLNITGDDLTEGTQYTVTVTTDAVDAYGINLDEELVFSFRAFGDFVTALGDELNQSAIFSVYPNPANNVISFSDEVVADVKIYNAAGQLVLSKRSASSLDISALYPGMYLVKAEFEGNIETRRIIKQ